MMILWGVLGFFSCAHAQKNKPHAQVERVGITYKGKKVNARQLTVCSEIPMALDKAWANVKTPSLLAFVAKGMIRFKAVEGEFPRQWETGQTYGLKMWVFGCVPFGGVHYLQVETLDEARYTIVTKEWDQAAKVWNHAITMEDIGHGRIRYADSITIYGGAMTGLITAFAKRFYIHRQKRWQVVAREKLDFIS